MTDGRSDAENLVAGINQIAELVMSEETVQSVLDLIVGLAQSTIPVADGVSVTVVRSDRFLTAARTAQEIADLDEMQYGASGGPCVMALRDGTEVHVHDLRADERWQRFAEESSGLGYRTILAIPLIPVSNPIGVLNLYGREAGAFNDEQRVMARRLAHQAAVAFANSGAFVQSEEANEQLREALASRDIIGQAKGILMERGDLSGDEAFDEMRAESQKSQRKLRDIAEEIVKRVVDRKRRD